MVTVMKSSKYPKRSNTHHDWLTVTMSYSPYQTLTTYDPKQSVKLFLIQHFDLNLDSLDTYDMIHGIYNYPSAMACFNGSMIVGFDKQKLMIQLSGRGIEALNDYYSFDKYLLCLHNLVDNGIQFSCTRWDLARDLFNWSSTYSPTKVWKQRAKGNLVSRTMYFNAEIASGHAVRPNALKGRDRELLLGSTLYLGKSPFQLRIYNKLAERYAKINVDYNFKRWTRWEFQLNGNKADYYFKKWFSEDVDLEEAWKMIASSNFKFVVDHTEKVDKSRNRNKLEIAKWWERLIDTDDNWDKAPSIVNASTVDTKAQFYKTTVAPNAVLRLNYLTRGYLRNGVSVEDARHLAITAFLNELVGSLRDKEDWVRQNKALFSGTAWNDFDSKLTILDTETGEIIDFKSGVDEEDE